MSTLFPLAEIESKTPAQSPEVGDWSFPQAHPAEFSVGLAGRLIDLCIAAQTRPEMFYTKSQGDDLFIAFRGQGDPAGIFNVRGSTEIKQVPFGGGYAYSPLAESYRAVVQDKLQHWPAKRLWLAGHGIGAAYALLAAIDLHNQNEVAAVYTFGCPRLGDKGFVRSLPCPVFRVVNNLDLMVTMPAPWNWRHAGRHYLITAQGRLLVNPQPWDRVPAMLRQTLWLGEMLADGLASGFPRAIYRLLTQVLGDHSAYSYRMRLHALQPPRPR
jgi:pimeloyl-ACP methyl ester carboxylesterase